VRAAHELKKRSFLSVPSNDGLALAFGSTFQPFKCVGQAFTYLRADKPTKQRGKKADERNTVQYLNLVAERCKLMLKTHGTQWELAFNSKRTIWHYLGESDFCLGAT